jgi:hypothetical protein
MALELAALADIILLPGSSRAMRLLILCQQGHAEELMKKYLRIRLTLMLILCLFISAPGLQENLLRQSPSANSQRMNRTTLAVADARPVAKAIEMLENQYGWVITYEDPRYVHSSEVADVTQYVRRDLDTYKPGEAPKVLSPKGGRLTFEFEIMPDTNLPSNPATVLQELLNAQAASPNAGRFRLENAGRIMHIIPTAIKNSQGELAPQESVLETTISLPAEEGTGWQRLQNICAAIREATKIPVTFGTIPHQLFLQHQVQQGATRQKARDILTALLEIVGNGRNLSWQLFYDPGFKFYVLNIHLVSKSNG